MMRILQVESLGSVGSGGSVALCYDEHVERRRGARAAAEEAGNGRKRRGMTDKRKRVERSGEDTGVGGGGRGRGERKGGRGK